MERLSKEDLLAKWKSNREKLYSELNFCIDHKFSLRARINKKENRLIRRFNI